LKKSLGILEQLPLSTKKLSQIKYPEEKFMKLKEAVKRKIFSLTVSSGSNSSGEGEMVVQLRKYFT
jgi:hypothetical protein